MGHSDEGAGVGHVARLADLVVAGDVARIQAGEVGTLHGTPVLVAVEKDSVAQSTYRKED